MTRLPAAAIASLCCLACAGQQGPPRHPVGELAARAAAKVGVVDLVVANPARAERLRHVYLRLVALAQEFDIARAHAMQRARSSAQQRATHGAQAEPPDTALLEALLAPPLAQSQTLFDRYATLMLEARSLLSAEEFATLNRVR